MSAFLLSPTTSIEKNKENLRQYGAAIHENFLSPAQLSALRGRLQEQAAVECEHGLATYFLGNDYQARFGTFTGDPMHQRVTCLVNKGQVFIDLAMHPLAVDYAKHILGDIQFNVGGQSGIILGKGAPKQIIHTDQQQVPFVTPTAMALSIMVALSEFEEDMGATRFVPGSHTGPPPSLALDPDQIDTVPAVMKPGDALIWDSRIWHGHGASTSDKLRYSVVTMYMAYYIKAPDCHPALIHDDVYERMSDEERKMYDFNSAGYVGRVGPRTPDDPRCSVGARMAYIPELHHG